MINRAENFISTLDAGSYEGQFVIRSSQNLDVTQAFSNLSARFMESCKTYRSARVKIVGACCLGFLASLLSPFVSFFGIYLLFKKF
ncbi:hypothetical protein TVAG_474760 [Trichomonas vaginalis G3]|uniref:Uncharacterized protein n=1 Tax=Trichomonas vaginalis (strain ATCC PRA-98 / G3) TaxID=412133 RepID=A2ERM6_TRIV3|nr:hypothetical protein TVAGG3_0345060 [Trichomonas vaginalis G3]EAY04678.1 hypothetical protein TVAG_474760 [Trichomonas vaginalis G3]KAI5530913.1 hypothetical protein TVAGG3_0345060 [Trichomonas vaginalis G3]|eukprot:XP_001316901.1 hypothetical protein [Trichomonas vaginalis G3]